MPRVLLLAVDDSDVSETVLEWTIDNVYKQGDEVIGGIGAMDSIVTVDPDPQTDLKHIAEAKEFMKRRFVTKLASRNIAYKVEIVHFLTDNDSIGEAVCKRAEALNAAAVVMAKHQRGAIAEFFLGSVTKYCTHHCKQPLVVLH